MSKKKKNDKNICINDSTSEILQAKGAKSGASYRIEIKKLKDDYIQKLKDIRVRIENEWLLIDKHLTAENIVDYDKFNISNLDYALIDIDGQLKFFNNQYLSLQELDSLNFIKEKLNLFTEQQQKVIKLLVFEEKNTCEIAEILSVTEETINKYCLRILERMQEDPAINWLSQKDNGELIVDDKIKLAKLSRPQDTIKKFFGSLLKERLEKAEMARINAIKAFKLFENS